MVFMRTVPVLGSGWPLATARPESTPGVPSMQSLNPHARAPAAAGAGDAGRLSCRRPRSELLQMAGIEDVRWSASRRLKSIAHLVDAAAMAPETHYTSVSNSSMVSAHRPSRDGLRRTTTAQRFVENRPEMQLHESSGTWSASADECDTNVSSLMPLPPQSTTPSQRPGTGELAVKSPRSLWHYVKALEKENAGCQYAMADSRAPTPALSRFVGHSMAEPEPEPAEPLLHGLPPGYAVFCREQQAGSSRRLFFPPWVQRPEVSWDDTVHSFESHRWMWATLTQANRRRVLQVPQHEILSRAVSDGKDTGGPSGFAMPANCAELLAEYLPSETFCRAVQEIFLQAMLHGQALVPVHVLTKYSRGRAIRDEQKRQAERARERHQAENSMSQTRGRRNPLAQPQRRRRKAHRRPRRRDAKSLDASELSSSSVSSMSLLLEELESQRVHETEKGGTVGQSGPEFHGMPEPSESGALRLMTNSLKKAKSIDPNDAMRQYRYPWRMPFLIRGAGATSDQATAETLSEISGEQQVSLSLTVHQASGIRAADRGGTSDPFVIVWLDGFESLTKAETSIKKKTLAPTWNETLLLRVPSGRGLGTTKSLPNLIVRVYDDDKLGKDFLGEVRIPPEVWAETQAGSKKLFKLEQQMDSSKRQAKIEITGAIVLSFHVSRVSLELDGLGSDSSRPWTPSVQQELKASRSLLEDGMGRPIRAPVGGLEGKRCMCFCIRCDCYRDANEFFLWNIEHGQHCSEQDCPSCFRRAVRWCWLCIEEELAETPHSLPREIHEEKAAADECCALVHWLLFILDERLHTAVGHPLHAAWGQPHGCNPLREDQHERMDAHLEELRLQHASLNHDWLFGCLEAPSQERFDYAALTTGTNPMMSTACSGTTLRSLPSAGSSRLNASGGIQARATDKSLPRSMASLSSGVVDDAEMQLIMHTIDEITAGGANNAAKLGPERAAHLAKLSRLMLRKIHQHSQDMGEHDTLILTHKYLYLRRLLASHREVPVHRDAAAVDMSKHVDVVLQDDSSPVVEHKSLRMNNSGGAMRAREALSPTARRRGVEADRGSKISPGSPSSPSSPSALSSSGILPGLHPDIESLLDPSNQEDAVGADEVLWEDVGQSGTMGWEARKLMKTLNHNLHVGNGVADRTSSLGEWAGAGHPSLHVKGVDQAKTRVAQHGSQEAVRMERRNRREELWKTQPSKISAHEKADLLRRRRHQQSQRGGMDRKENSVDRDVKIATAGLRGHSASPLQASSAYHAAPWGADPPKKQLGNQIRYGALVSAGTWDKIVGTG